MTNARNKMSISLKTISTILLFVIIPLFGFAQETKAPIYTSPIVNSDRTIIFNIYAPKAENIKVLSTIQLEAIPLIKAENGLWSKTIGPVAPEVYHYQFDIDGAIVTDMKNQSPYPWLTCTHCAASRNHKRPLAMANRPH